MVNLQTGYTLADIVGFAREQSLTYLECAEILEGELYDRFPWFHTRFYERLWKSSSSVEEYCIKLVRVGRKLEQMAQYASLHA